VIQTLQRNGIAEVIDPATAFLTTRGGLDRYPESMSGVRDLARATLSGLVVIGSINRVADSVEYSARLVDARSARVVSALDPIRSPLSDVTARLDEVRSRVAGAIAAQTNSVTVPLSGASRPTKLEAYQEFAAGLDLFNTGRSNEARGHFHRAIAIDSTFTLAMIWLYYRYWADRNDVSDSSTMMARLIAEGRTVGLG
jgi:TolB-like protein